MLLAGLLVGLAAPSPAAGAPAARGIAGTWEAVAVERAGKRAPLQRGRRTRVTFRPGGALLAVERDGRGTTRKRGRWKITGAYLITQVAQRVDLARYRLKGDRLELTRRGAPGRTGFTMIMRRVGR